ncbi:hypothetical protein TgHK011_006547 [Trichoderma gracile]|nr:hypothetical protein TgHK011_006547 [Trichoderma gracile]
MDPDIFSGGTNDLLQSPSSVQALRENQGTPSVPPTPPRIHLSERGRRGYAKLGSSRGHITGATSSGRQLGVSKSPSSEVSVRSFGSTTTLEDVRICKWLPAAMHDYMGHEVVSSNTACESSML